MRQTPHIPHIIKAPLLMVALLCGARTATAQDMDHVLQLVAANNMQLQAATQTRQADLHQMKSEQALEGTEVSYSPFYTSGVGGIASSELVVSQGFDFPTLYSARRRARHTATEQMEWQQTALRQDILLQARLLCLQIIYLQKGLAIMDRRTAAMAEMQRLFDVKLAKGQATLMETNKLKMEQARLATERMGMQNKLQQARHALNALNGGVETAFTQADYPQWAQLGDDATTAAAYLATDAAVKATALSTETDKRRVQVSRMELMPRLAVGYRRNTEMKEARNGFLVGATVPLFAGRHKVHEARLRQEASESSAKEQLAQTQAYVQALLEERRLLQSALAACDAGLTDSALATLSLATEKGQLTAIQYCQEAEAAYANLSLREENLYRLHCVEAMLRKGEL